MKRLPRNENQLRICVPIVETHLIKAAEAIKEANSSADLIEIRADYLKEPNLSPIMKNRKKPFIITNRRKEEGGNFRGNEQERFGILKEAISLGAEYVDAEMESDRLLLQNLIENKNGTKIILSFHNFDETPSSKELKRLFDRMTRWEADVIKMITFARSWEDNLTVLSLIPYAHNRKQKIVAFCMGDKGKMSRVFSPMMGAAWTYAALSEKKTSAPGQLTVREIKEVWEKLNFSPLNGM